MSEAGKQSCTATPAALSPLSLWTTADLGMPEAGKQSCTTPPCHSGPPHVWAWQKQVSSHVPQAKEGVKREHKGT